MTQLFANNASSTLAFDITNSDTSLVLAEGTGALFPNPIGGDYFLLTLTQASTESSWEIVKVTARSTDTLTIERAQEGTTAAVWLSGDKGEARLTAGSMPASGGSPFASDIVVNGIKIGRSTGNVASNFNLQTGSLAAQVTGDLAVTQTAAGGYTILEPTFPNAGHIVYGVTLELVSGTCAVLPTVNVKKYSSFLDISPPPNLSGASEGSVFSLPDVSGHWANTGQKMTWSYARLPNRPNNTVAIGENVLTSTTGNNNLGIGINAGRAITSGSGNIIIGSDTGSGISTTNNNLLITTLGGLTKLHIGPNGQFGLGQGSGYWGISGQTMISNGSTGGAAWGTPSVISRATVDINASFGLYFPFVNANHLDITNSGASTVSQITWSYYLPLGAEIVCQFLAPVTFNSATAFPGAPTPFTAAIGDVVTFRYASTGVAKVISIYHAVPSGGTSYSVTSPVVLTGTVISMPAATPSANGYMTSAQAIAVAAVPSKTVVEMSGLDIDCTYGAYFRRTLATGNSTLTISNPPASGTAGEITVQLNATPSFSFTGVGASSTWESIACSADGVKLIACDSSSTVCLSTDSGRTWAPATIPNGNAKCVASSSDGVKLVVVGFNTIATSTDSGATWTSRKTDVEFNKVVSSSDGTKLVATHSSYTGLYTSTDSGVTWTLRENTLTFKSISCSSDGTKLVAGCSPGIYISIDSGVTWTFSFGNFSFAATYISDDGTKMLAASPYGVYYSTNSGVSWSVTSNAFGMYIYPVLGKIAVNATGSIAYVTRLDGGQIYRSTNFGLTWVNMTNVSPAEPRGICCSSDGTKVYVAAYHYSGNAKGKLSYMTTAYSSVTWPSSVFWSGGVAPTLSATNIFKFLNTDGGVRWNCISSYVSTN